MSGNFSQIPQNATVEPESFELRIRDNEIDGFKTLLKLSKISPQTWGNQQADRRLGITHE